MGENTDYKQLCQELFGTTDVAELRLLSKKLKRNSRNAGRKKKFTETELNHIRMELSLGTTIDSVAKKHGTSRQIVSKYVNQPPELGYTLRMEYMYRHQPCTLIDVNFMEKHVKIQNRTDDLLHRAFGILEEPTWDDFNQFLLERCPPPSRGNIKDILAALALTDYDPLQIVEKTAGRTEEDQMWIRFQYFNFRGEKVANC